jgi:exopolysaccharide production negative regulator
MRMSKAIAAFIATFLAFAPGAGSALDATKRDEPLTKLSPTEAFRAGTRAYFAGDKSTAFQSLLAAAERGHAIAQWKLGRMYAEGDGIAKDHLKAFEYFSRIADAHADDNPADPEARFISNSFVALGSYYLSGIPGTGVGSNARRALDLFTYAASYFGDADAQFELGRIYLTGKGVEKSAPQAARWLGLAARKDHRSAQATLGEILFRGKGVPRRSAEGLMWLELARSQAEGAGDSWILLLHEHAFAESTASDRERAYDLVEIYRRRMATSVPKLATQ